MNAYLEEEEEMSTPLITTWTHKGVRYFAARRGGCVHVFDETGRNFGGFFCERDFRRAQRKQNSLAEPVYGVVFEVIPRVKEDS